MPPSLHSGLIERAGPRARPLAMAAVKRIEPVAETTAPLSMLTPVKPPVGRPELRVQQPAASPEKNCRRCGLTVRVSHETRQVLEEVRARSGGTFQHILHSAVTGYLDGR